MKINVAIDDLISLILVMHNILCFGTEWAPTSLRQLLVVAIGHALQAQIPSFLAGDIVSQFRNFWSLCLLLGVVFILLTKCGNSQ